LIFIDSDPCRLEYPDVPDRRRAFRHAVHIAVMERHGIRSILSFDADFDRWAGLQRIHQV